MKTLILLATLSLASCAGRIQVLPDGSVIVDPDPVVLTPQK